VGGTRPSAGPTMRRREQVELAGRIRGRQAGAQAQADAESGEQTRLVDDAATFLEVKIDGQPRRWTASCAKVAIYYRDFRPEAD